MGPVRDPGERRQRFALGARAQNRDFVRRQMRKFLGGDESAWGSLNVIQLLAHVDGFFHAPAEDDDFSAMFNARFNNLLDSVDIAGESGNDDSSLDLAENCFDAFSDLFFRYSKFADIGVGRVGKQAEHAFFGIGSELCVFGVLEKWCEVEFEIPSMDDVTETGFDGDSERIGDAVVGSEEGHLEIFEIKDGIVVVLNKINLKVPEFRKLVFD